MSNHVKVGSSNIHISIPEAVKEHGVTFYSVSVKVGSIAWTVQRRYSDFVDLHNAIIVSGVAKESLPEKKVFGNKDPGFIMKRRKELEIYIRDVFEFLKRAIPASLAKFLDFDAYDINFVLRTLASERFDDPKVDSKAEFVDWTPLELHAVSERLKSPLPPPPLADDETEAKRYDFANVADRVCSMNALRIKGSRETFKASNILLNELNFDFDAFKALTKLCLLDVQVQSIASLGHAKKSLKQLQIHRCSLKAIAQILLCDARNADIQDNFGDAESESRQEAESLLTKSSLIWENLEHLDLRYNVIERVDRSVALAPKLQTLLLGSNRIELVENLSGSTHLTRLDFSDNNLNSELNGDLHVKLGQVTKIDVNHNRLKDLKPFSKLYSLKSLVASANRISDLDSALPVSGLPCLEELNLHGNAVTAIVDYRLKVLESFGKRCAEIKLDNEMPTQSEVDKVSILMALRVSREGLAATSLFGNLPGHQAL